MKIKHRLLLLNRLRGRRKKANPHLSWKMVELARRGAEQIKLPGRMCSGCPFKPGTKANGEYKAVDNAFQAMLLPQARFICHKELVATGAQVDCVGFLYAKQVE